MAQLTQEIIDAAIEGFEAQKKRIDAQIAELRSLGSGHTTSAAPEYSGPKKKGGMSAAGRKAIAKAQRRRWAEKRGQPSPKTAKKAGRQLSAEGRAAIVAALKKRWAAKKEAAKAAK